MAPPVATDTCCTFCTVKAESSWASTRTSRNHKNQTSSKTTTHRRANTCFHTYSALVLCYLHCLQNPQKPRKNNHEVTRKVEEFKEPSWLLPGCQSHWVSWSNLEMFPRNIIFLSRRKPQRLQVRTLSPHREDCLVLTSWSLANPETKSSCRTQQRGQDRGRQKVTALMCKVIF